MEGIAMSRNASTGDMTKREFIKKASYVVPTVVTLAAAPSFASAGSRSHGPKKAKKAKKAKKVIKVKHLYRRFADR
jgi:hypothetical protein